MSDGIPEGATVETLPMEERRVEFLFKDGEWARSMFPFHEKWKLVMSGPKILDHPRCSETHGVMIYQRYLPEQPKLMYGVSNDGGKTSIYWRDSAQECLDFLEPHKAQLPDYCVVVVRKPANKG